MRHRPVSSLKATADIVRRAIRRSHLLRALIVLLVAIPITTEFGFGFFSLEALLVAFGTLGALAFFPVMVLVRLLRKQWNAAQAHGLCLLALLVALRISDHIGDHHARTAKEAAQPLITALDQYRNDTGNFPARLLDLTPRYLETIAAAPVAFVRERPYKYSLSEDGEFFYLSFPAPGGYIHSFSTKTRTWRMHD